jgi:hypothetical protein
LTVFQGRRHTGKGFIPRLEGDAQLLAVVGVLGVPVLVALCPPWLRRWFMPMLAVSSIGIYLTVPDTEHVLTVMLIVVLVAIGSFALRLELPSLLAAGVAVVMMVNALADSAGQPAPIARAIGCFGALLAVPVARYASTRAGRGEPAVPPVLLAHCAVVLFSSRALIREESPKMVVAAVAIALAGAVTFLVATAKR